MDQTKMDRPEVHLFTDGACIGNPGPGGWAFILKHPASGRSKEGSGSQPATTNNRMEITAVVRGLQALKKRSLVRLFSDSQYVIDAVDSWLAKWKRFGFKPTKNASKQIKNVDLWKELDSAMQEHIIEPVWIRGHNGHPENERCDELATAAAQRAARMPTPSDNPLAIEPSIFDDQRREGPSSR